MNLRDSLLTDIYHELDNLDFQNTTVCNGQSGYATRQSDGVHRREQRRPQFAAVPGRTELHHSYGRNEAVRICRLSPLSA